MMEEGLVSIIVPVYNSESFLSETIESVQNQSYSKWEMLMVDDCSTDNSSVIINEYCKNDPRIKYIKLETNSGAAVARNKALAESVGQYIAYLDADDVWLPNKLERQIDFILNSDIAFTCCDYEKIDCDGTKLNKIIHMPKTLTYNQFLRNTIIQTVGVIVDLDKVDKSLLNMPNVRRGQDAATWCQLLRNGIKFYGQNEVLAQYRRVPTSLSSNKFKAMKRTWYLYRKIEKLCVIKAIWCLFGWAYHAIIKRIYFKKRKSSKNTNQ